jgi:hypothetical protein
MPKPRSPYEELTHTEIYVRERTQPNGNKGYSRFSFDLIIEVTTSEIINGMTVGERDKHIYRVRRYIAACGDELVVAACLSCKEMQNSLFGAGPAGLCREHATRPSVGQEPTPFHNLLRVRLVEHAYELWNSALVAT